MLSSSLSLRMLPRSGSLTYVKPLSLLYYKWHRTTPVGSSPVSSAPPPFYLPNFLFPFPPFAIVSGIFSEPPGLALPVFPCHATLNALTSLARPLASPTPFLPYQFYLQSLKHRPFPCLIYSHPTLPFPHGPTHALLYNQKTIITVFTK